LIGGVVLAGAAGIFGGGKYFPLPAIFGAVMGAIYCVLWLAYLRLMAVSVVTPLKQERRS
jgi:hypothetical protein